MSGNENSEKNNWLDALFENNSSNQIKYNEALANVRQNFRELYPYESFLQLNQEKFCKLLESDDLNVPNEEMVFDSVKRWLDFHNLNPHTHLKSLLRVVRLSLLPIKYLFDVVEPYVYPVLNCRNTFIDVLRYHIFGENKINETIRKYQKISRESIKLKLNSEIIPESTENISKEPSTGSNDLNTAKKPNQNTDLKIEKKSSNKLVFLGSWFMNTGNVIETFDAIEKKWKRLKDLPVRKKHYTVNIIDNKLLIIGGDVEKPLNTVDAIDLSSGEMMTLPPLKYARSYAPSVVVQEGNKEVLYLFGGSGDNFLLSSVEIWDPAANKWTEGVPMKSKRTGHGVVYLNGKIYSVGGRTNILNLNILEAFEIKNKIWTSKAPMKNINANFGITTFKDHIYVVGGLRKFGTPISVVERYNPLDDSWTTLANIKSSAGVGVCSFGNRMICAGGSLNDVQEYDDEKDEWVSLPSMEVTRSGFLLELPEGAKLEN